MFVLVRGIVAAALVILLSFSVIAADKPYKRDDLADAAIKLEAQIKSEAGQVTKPRGRAAARSRCRIPAQRLPHRLAAARPDRHGGAGRQRQLAAAGQAVLQIRPSNDRERTVLLERAATAAYIAYQRSTATAAKRPTAC